MAFTGFTNGSQKIFSSNGMRANVDNTHMLRAELGLNGASSGIRRKVFVQRG